MEVQTNNVLIQSAKKTFFTLFFVASFFKGSLFASFNFANQQSTLRFNKTNSQFILNTALTGFDGMLDLKDNAASTVSGSNITFSSGVLKTNTVQSVFNGIYDPTSTDTITLGNGHYLDVKSGSIVQAITVSATSTASIYGDPIFSGNITLSAADSILQLAITTPLNQSVTGSGQVTLLSDLVVGKSKQLPSLVGHNGKVLTFVGGTISSAFTSTGGGTIEIGGYTNLSVALTVGTTGDVYVINGNGAVLDLTGSGEINFAGQSLYLNDVHIRGLSSVNPIHGTGTIYLSKVTFELGGNFLRADGSFNVFGDPCKLVTNGYTFVMSGTGSDLVIDGVTLYYEQVSGSGANPFSAVSGANITYLNGGSIVSAFGSVNENLTVPGTTWTMAKDFFLSGSTKIFFTNATPLVAKNVAFDGAGQFISFPFKTGTYVNLEDNEKVTFSNTVFKNFYPAAYSLGASATVSYGDGVRIELGPDITIASGDAAWAFTGNAEIDGNGATLTINKAQGLTITGAKTLSLKNMRIVSSVANGISALTTSASVTLNNVELVLLDAGFLFDTGNLNVNGVVKITGGANASNPATTFELKTSGLCTIASNSELFVDRNVTLKYNCDPAGGDTYSATKRHMVFSNANSVLTLCGCSLLSTATAVAFDLGTIQVVDKVAMTINTAAGSEAEIGSNVRVNLSAGAVLDVNGPLKYIA